MIRPARPLRSALLVGGALTLTLWASVGVALGAPGGSALALAPWQGGDYATDGSTAFEPVSLDLVSELLGDEGDSLLPPAPGVSMRVPGSFDGPAFPVDEDEPGDPAGPTESPSPLPAEEEDHADPTPPPGTPKRPVLSVSIASDRTSARQGDRILYTITVRNIGDADAEGVVAETHVPMGTTQTEGTACEGDPLVLDPDPGDGSLACVNANGFVSTGGSDESHIVFVIGQIEAQKTKTWLVEVRVDNDTSNGTVLRNHAHARSEQHSIDVTSREVMVTVV